MLGIANCDRTSEGPRIKRRISISVEPGILANQGDFQNYCEFEMLFFDEPISFEYHHFAENL